MAGSMKQQAAIDFMVSYGVAILILTISIYVILRLGIFGNSLAQPSCVSTVQFTCSDIVQNANGLVTLVLTQATGGAINITGIACASGLSSNGNLPAYGNAGVQSNTVAPQYYLSGNVFTNGLVVYSGQSAVMRIYCYGSTGIYQANLGTPFSGYIWLNYTYVGLPTTYHTVQRVVQYTTRLA